MSKEHLASFKPVGMSWFSPEGFLLFSLFRAYFRSESSYKDRVQSLYDSFPNCKVQELFVEVTDASS